MNRRALLFAVVVFLMGGPGTGGTVRAALGQSPESPARGYATLELTLAYSADRTNGVVGGCGCFWLNGGKAENSAAFSHGISIVSELAGQHGSHINSTLNSLSFVSYLFGPRYSFRSRSRLVPFAQFLVGGVHGFDALFPSPGSSIPNPTAFAFAAGGGLNTNLSHRVGIRIVQADYFQTHLPNDTNNLQNHLRISAGIVLRFGVNRR